MLIPSIDLQNGRAVQLRGGRELVIDAGDPLVVAERFGRVGEIAVIDLDAAKGVGNNRDLMRQLVRRHRCRVGGGIRSAEEARGWLDAGAYRVILGTAATPEILRELPGDRVVAALDAEHGDVVVEGWAKKTESSVEGRIDELRDLVGGFLVTLVEREGRMEGADLERAADLAARCGAARLTFAGGVCRASEIAHLDRLGVDAQVGMALYSGHLDLAEAFAAPLTSDRDDGLWPTVVSDERGVALGLAWSNLESLRRSIESGKGMYRSRSRGLWEKGATSGDVQDLLAIRLDCDRDALQFMVRQSGLGFCHERTRTCWGDDGGLGRLGRRLRARLKGGDPSSYTVRLAGDVELLRAKLREEADEFAAELDGPSKEALVWEAADLIYFVLTSLVRAGVDLAEVERELDRRAMASRR